MGKSHVFGNRVRCLFKWAAPFLLCSELSFAASGVTYQGRLISPDGASVVSPNVQFKMQIRTPGTEDCLMYEEIQSHDLSTTNGMFAVSLGAFQPNLFFVWKMVEVLEIQMLRTYLCEKDPQAAFCPN